VFIGWQALADKTRTSTNKRRQKSGNHCAPHILVLSYVQEILQTCTAPPAGCFARIPGENSSCHLLSVSGIIPIFEPKPGDFHPFQA
jgi:hypothetical protein